MVKLDCIYNEDCLQGLKKIQSNSVDAVITDPPYGLSFMGKKWDYNVPSVDIWKECLRVLKPGGYLLSFGGTRTCHRLTCAVEDAGFEIRDMIMWVYGSGFPKSLNIGKAVDKVNGIKIDKIGSGERETTNAMGNGLKNRCNVCGKPFFSGNPCQCERAYKPQNEWGGWGTALKPALEPITVARKPLSEKTVAENVLKWGTGGINIDGCRVECGTEHMRGNVGAKVTDSDWKEHSGFGKSFVATDSPLGRFPANLIHDGSDEVVGLFPNTKSGNNKRYSGYENKFNNASFNFGDKSTERDRVIADSGSASRFFYCAKASKDERNKGCEGLKKKVVAYGNQQTAQLKRGEELTPNAGVGDGGVIAPQRNNHPTVKPIALMEYLIKLVSREDAVILDPFIGSGTTAVACKRLNRRFIGFEINNEYYNISLQRLLNVPRRLEYFVRT